MIEPAHCGRPMVWHDRYGEWYYECLVCSLFIDEANVDEFPLWVREAAERRVYGPEGNVWRP